MRQLCIVSVVAVLIPTAADSREPATTTAAKAKCVRELILSTTIAIYGKGPPAPLPGTPSPAEIAAAKDRLERYDRIVTPGLAACLSKDDVMHLGMFSFLEDSGAHCRLGRTKAVPRGVVNGADIDFVNAASTTELSSGKPIDSQTFFRGQSMARLAFKIAGGDPREICKTLLDGFGPKGSIMPGIVERTR